MSASTTGNESASKSKAVENAADKAESVIDRATSGAHSAVDGAARKAKPAIDHVADMAHHAVDSAAGAAAPTVDWLAEQGESLQGAQKKLLDDTCSYVQAHPLKSLGLAVAAGFLLSRILRS